MATTDPISKLREDAAKLRNAAAQLRAYSNRLAIEGVAMRCPSDRDDNAEHVGDVLECALLCDNLAKVHDAVATGTDAMSREILRGL